MEININIGAGGLSNRIASTRPVPVAAEVNDVSFNRSEALESGLTNVPETRPEAVARARSLVADPSYPPEEMIRKISLLMAMKLESGAV